MNTEACDGEIWDSDNFLASRNPSQTDLENYDRDTCYGNLEYSYGRESDYLIKSGGSYDDSDNTSNVSSSTYYSRSGTYVSDDLVQEYVSERLTSSSSEDDIDESVSNLREQLRGETIDAKEFKTILNELDHGHIIGAIYPNPSRLELFRQNPHLEESFSSIARRRDGNVFISWSLLPDHGQEDGHEPAGVLFDVCILSPTQPVVLLTISSGEASSSVSSMRHNAKVARNIRRTVGNSTLKIDLVNGVASWSTLMAGDLEKCVRELESDAYKTAFPEYLLMDNQKYRHVLASILPTEAIPLEETLEGASGCAAAFREHHEHAVRPETDNVLALKLHQNEEGNRRLQEKYDNQAREMLRLQRRNDELCSAIQDLETTLFREYNIRRFLTYQDGSCTSSSQYNHSSAASTNIHQKDGESTGSEEETSRDYYRDVLEAKLQSLGTSLQEVMNKTYTHDDSLFYDNMNLLFFKAKFMKSLQSSFKYKHGRIHGLIENLTDLNTVYSSKHIPYIDLHDKTSASLNKNKGAKQEVQNENQNPADEDSSMKSEDNMNSSTFILNQTQKSRCEDASVKGEDKGVELVQLAKSDHDERPDHQTDNLLITILENEPNMKVGRKWM